MAVITVGTGVVATAAAPASGLNAPALASSALGLTAPTPTLAADVSSQGGGRLSVHAGSAVTPADADSAAKTVLATGALVARNATGKVDATPLTESIAALAGYRNLDADTIMTRVATTQTAAEDVGTATMSADLRIAAARTLAAKKAAIAAQAKADAERQAAANTPAAAKATAKALMASQYGWGDDQYTCLVSLWTKESGWNYKAYNPSGATGIPQALPGSKMATVADDWATNATTQIIWGLRYISGSYGTPCSAWAHSEANDWY